MITQRSILSSWGERKRHFIVLAKSGKQERNKLLPRKKYISWIQRKHGTDFMKHDFFYQRQENLYTLYHQKQGNFEDISDQKQENMIWTKIILGQKQESMVLCDQKGRFSNKIKFGPPSPPVLTCSILVNSPPANVENFT